MPTFVAGNLATIKVTAAGTDTPAIVMDAKVKSSDLDMNAAQLDSTVVGDAVRQRISGIEDWIVVLDVQFTNDAWDDFIKPGTTIRVRVQPDPTESADAQLDKASQWDFDDALIEQFKPVTGIDDVIRGPLTLRCSDGVGVISTMPV